MSAVDRGTRVDQAEGIASAIAHRLSREFDCMKELLGACGDEMIDTISAEVSSQLTTIRGLIADGAIFPRCNIRLSQGASHPAACGRPLRIGVLTSAADPFHWMHMLSGLKAMAAHKLDKVVYVIAGCDPRKPDLLQADIRHRMGQDILRLFEPLFAYSPIAFDNALDGESNIFRILQLNPGQRIDAFYIAGTDHYYRHNPQTGEADTIQKLEDGVRGRIFGFDERMNSISAIFVGRGQQKLSGIETFLNVEFVQGMPFEASSTAIRKALAGHESITRLAALPYSVFSSIEKSALYSPAVPGNSWARFKETGHGLQQGPFPQMSALRRAV